MTMPPKDRAKRELKGRLDALRRDHILDAAVDVFKKKGLAGSSVSDVARAAGIADGTIYNYFKDKTALLLAVLHRLNETDKRPAHIETLHPDATFEEAFGRYLQHRFDVMTEQLELFPALFAEILRTPVLREVYLKEIVEPNFALMKPRFEALIEQGLIRPINIDPTVRAIAAMFVGLLLLHGLGDPELRRRWNELPDTVASLLLVGLLPRG